MFITNPTRILSHTTVLAIAFALLLAGPATSYAQGEANKTIQTAPYKVGEIVKETNEARLTEGLPALATSSKLTIAAQLKANHMATNRYFGHWSPDGKTPWDFITMAGYDYYTAGENLAIHFMETEDMVKAWLNSPTHRANLLNPSFKETGIGIAYGESDGEKGWVVVQMFGSSF